MFSTQLKKDNSTLFIVLFLSIFLFLTGCASHTVLETGVKSVGIHAQEIDPYENFNRKSYAFNEVLDNYVAEPIADVYLWITPKVVQTGVSNFFSNLNEINVVLNDIMQGKLLQGSEDTGRFIVNSTIGLGGLFDVAKELGLEKHDEDFSQTLAVWGVPQGPYLVIPVLGPMTTRGIPGGLFDIAANPTSYVGGIFFPVQLLQVLNARASADGDLRFIDEAALDPYIFTREAFLQYRKNLIADGNVEIEDNIFDLEDELFDEDEEISDKLNNMNNNKFNEQEERQLQQAEAGIVEADLDAKIEALRLKIKLRSANQHGVNNN
ncbi:MAG: VacJ family lipoprotein [Methylococcales bacterium]|nr:VacJ family lipoprotein [Methylococcales bacterium]